ncbi:MAG: SPFH domain-containing protein [Ectothiorhodospiraceae bacterium]
MNNSVSELTPILVTLILLALVVVFIAKGLVMVHQRRTMVIERLGKYHRTLDPGLRFIIPFIDQPRQVSILRFSNGEPIITRERLVDMREVVLDFPSQNVITQDNVNVQIDGVLYYQIMDAQAAAYGTENLVLAIQTLAQTSLRSEIGTMELDKIFESRQDINDRLQTTMDEAGGKWGVKVNRVEIRDIDVPNEIREAMNSQMVAERNRRATVREAEGYKQAEIERAEGDKQAAILKAQGERDAAIANAEGDKKAAVLLAEGESTAIARVMESFGDAGNPAEMAVNYLIAQRYMHTLPTIAKDGERVFLPTEMTSLMGSIGGIQELLKPVR